MGDSILLMPSAYCSPPLLVYPQCLLAVKSRFAGEGKEWGLARGKQGMGAHDLDCKKYRMLELRNDRYFNSARKMLIKMFRNNPLN